MSERVYREMKSRIISGDLSPGTRLVEAQVASEMGVSRTPVREALKRMAAEGLVSRDGLGGLIVYAASPDEIEQLYLVREVLDGLAARLAAHRVSPDELAKLKLIHDAMSRAVAARRMNEIVAANIAFHDLVYEIAGNPRLSEIAKDLRDFVRRFSSEAFSSDARVDAVLREHEAIVSALATHDADGAEAAARQHLREARMYLTYRRLGETMTSASG